MSTFLAWFAALPGVIVTEVTGPFGITAGAILATAALAAGANAVIIPLRERAANKRAARRHR